MVREKTERVPGRAKNKLRSSELQTEPENGKIRFTKTIRGGEPPNLREKREKNGNQSLLFTNLQSPLM